MTAHPLAGKLPSPSMLIDVPALVTAYFSNSPDPEQPGECVSFGTSGHRGSAFDRSFNEDHIIAIVEAIRRYRVSVGTDGPLFLGWDTHALSEPARVTTLEVLAASGVDLMISANGDYTPTPAVSHAILSYNRGRTSGLADGIVITPSHNPPADGGIKYNAPNGGPAAPETTTWIEKNANTILTQGVATVKRVPLARALAADTTHQHDYRTAYVEDLGSVLDLEAVRSAGLNLGADPLGGAGVHYWAAIADHYHLNLTTLSTEVDPTFRFMTVDTDGQIRMDPSSADAMQRLIGMRDSFDVSFACDTDYDRHGIVTRGEGLMPPNNYLAVAASYVLDNRPDWPSSIRIGKTVVTTRMIDRVCHAAGREFVEVPVGFKWFVDGLFEGSLGFVCEESAGATLLRRDGTPWTTDKDGIAAALLAAEITARLDRDPAERYQELTREFGTPRYRRLTAPASADQKRKLKSLESDDVDFDTIAGEKITKVLTRAPGNDAAIGGLKVETADSWFAVRPSGTEDLYKIYVESVRDDRHIDEIVEGAQEMVREVLDSP